MSCAPGFDCNLGLRCGFESVSCGSGIFCPESTLGDKELDRVFCEEGFACDAVGVQRPCPKDHFCPLGTVEPITCHALAPTCAKDGAAREVWLLPIVILILIVIVGRLVIAAVAMRQRRRQRSATVVPTPGTPIRETVVPIADASGKTPTVSLVFDRVGFAAYDLQTGSKKQIISNVSGKLRPGKITLLLGPSGSGKSTLLNMLSGITLPTQGQLLANGHPCKIRDLRKIIGFVPQEDIMIKSLTVYQLLMHSALTRLPSSWSFEDKKALVEDTIETLRLSHRRDSVIGDEHHRGLSGGERKRVSIGIESVAAPTILLLDEPTSGLDSNSSMAVISSLRSIANRRRMTVFAVLHQPRYEIVDMCDDLLLMAKGGKMAYFGPVDSALPYFRSLGYKPPSKANPADFFLEIMESHSANMVAAWAKNPVAPSPAIRERSKTVAAREVLNSTTTTASTTTTTDSASSGSGSGSLGGKHHKSSGLATNSSSSMSTDGTSTNADQTRSTATYGSSSETYGTGGYTSTEDDGGKKRASKSPLARLGKPMGEPAVDEPGLPPSQLKRATPNFFVVFLLYLKRNAQQQVGEYVNVLIGIGLQCITGIAMGLVTSQGQRLNPALPSELVPVCPGIIKEMCENQYPLMLNMLIWNFFFVLAGGAMSAISGSMVMGNELKEWQREEQAGGNHYAYFLAKNVFSAIFVMLESLATASCFWLLGSPRSSFSNLFLVFFILGYCGYAVGFIVSLSTRRELHLVTSAVIGVSLAIFSGSFPSLASVKKDGFLRFFWSIIYTRWVGEALYLAELSPMTPESRAKPIAATRGYNLDGFTIAIIYALLCGLFLRLVAIALLRLKFVPLRKYIRGWLKGNNHHQNDNRNPNLDTSSSAPNLESGEDSDDGESNTLQVQQHQQQRRRHGSSSAEDDGGSEIPYPRNPPTLVAK